MFRLNLQGHSPPTEFAIYYRLRLNLQTGDNWLRLIAERC